MSTKKLICLGLPAHDEALGKVVRVQSETFKVTVSRDRIQELFCTGDVYYVPFRFLLISKLFCIKCSNTHPSRSPPPFMFFLLISQTNLKAPT